MTTKYTKGPWVYNKQQRHQNFIEIQHLDQSAGASSLVIARVVVRQTWKQEQEANARLIAAAPDLLEVLIIAKDKMEVEGYFPTPEIESAIAKALGDS